MNDLFCGSNDSYPLTDFVPKSIPWDSMRLIGHLNQSNIILSEEVIRLNKLIFWGHLCSEYDAENFCLYLKQEGFVLSPEFKAFEYVWRRDEYNHYVGFQHIYCILYDTTAQEVEDMLNQRSTNFEPIKSLLEDEFKTCLLLAYDEIATTKSYVADYDFYQSFGHRNFLKWIKLVTRNPDGDPQHKQWHYIDFPYLKPGSTVPVKQPKTPNAQLQINSLMAAIPGESDSPKRAKELAWLFHLVEDIHQPLHCAELYDEDFKNGDTGGNDVMVTKNKEKNLHWTWDDLVGGGPHDFVNWPTVGYNLYHSPKYTPASLTELQTNTTLLSWMQKESYQYAVKYAYLNGTISSPDVNNPSTLSPAYKAQASAVAERRVVLAGIRLAQILDKLYGGKLH